MTDDRSETQEELERRLGKRMADDSSPENYQKAYDEFHRYLLKYGIRDAPARGYIYKQRLSLFDRRLLGLVGKNRKVLDIGCGEGTLALACAKNKNEVVALDISSVAVQLAESRKGDLPARFAVGDARNLNFPDNSFDVIICKDVIEHIPQRDLIIHLEEVKRVLKEDGFYLLYTPSKLLGDLSLGLHLSGYGLADLVSILRRDGFKVEVICHWLSLLGLPVRTSRPTLVSIIMTYEELIERARIGCLLAKWGNWGYAVVPAVWLRAVKNSS
jgi:2-polyprenyl-3-methyl-5-hydroxy-6-metoxy-1,4-benzoquinol methylase